MLNLAGYQKKFWIKRELYWHSSRKIV
jgi:hypothetical protein